MRTEVLVVGAGISGVTAARVLAEAGKRVLIVEKRFHLGGNCYDEYDAHGLLIHRYGPHIFHTRHRTVWAFLSRFTKWHPYQHRVLAWVNGTFVPFPVSPLTLEVLYGRGFSTEDFRVHLEKVKVDLGRPPRNSKEVIVSQVGEELYRLFFENYTRKQWGMSPEELLPEVCARIPVRLLRDARYFTDPWQGIPREGYTRMFERMVAHPNLGLLLGVDYLRHREDFKADCIIYTGPLDAFFEHCFGPLPYRRLEFVFETHFQESFQPAAVVNYPNDYDFTRITEYKKITGQKHPFTTISYEYPGEKGIECYPIPTPDHEERKQKYLSLVKKEKKVYFLGRLALYRYLNMDQAVLEALELARNLLKDGV